MTLDKRWRGQLCSKHYGVSKALANGITMTESHKCRSFCCLRHDHEDHGHAHTCLLCLPENSPLFLSGDTRHPWNLLPWEVLPSGHAGWTQSTSRSNNGLVEPETRPSVDKPRPSPTNPASTGQGGREQAMPPLFPTHQGSNPRCTNNCSRCVEKAKSNTLILQYYYLMNTNHCMKYHLKI